jgi:hypothetical protein
VARLERQQAQRQGYRDAVADERLAQSTGSSSLSAAWNRLATPAPAHASTWSRLF